MPFKTPLIVSSVLVMLTAAFIGWLVTRTTASDIETYQKMVEMSGQKTTLVNIADYEAKQDRVKTVKTLLLSEGDERRIGVLASDSSTLLYLHTRLKSELIEKMQGVFLTYQEELNESPEKTQTVITLNAEHATYFYAQEKLQAENVLLNRYLVQGHRMPDKNSLKDPIFSGEAGSVVITFADEYPAINAKQLKANVKK